LQLLRNKMPIKRIEIFLIVLCFGLVNVSLILVQYINTCTIFILQREIRQLKNITASNDQETDHRFAILKILM
jgi:hypothetical protein